MNASPTCVSNPENNVYAFSLSPMIYVICQAQLQSHANHASVHATGTTKAVWPKLTTMSARTIMKFFRKYLEFWREISPMKTHCSAPPILKGQSFILFFYCLSLLSKMTTMNIIFRKGASVNRGMQTGEIGRPWEDSNRGPSASHTTISSTWPPSVVKWKQTVPPALPSSLSTA